MTIVSRLFRALTDQGAVEIPQGTGKVIVFLSDQSISGTDHQRFGGVNITAQCLPGGGPEALTAALTLALERYGECLSVTGSETFKEHVIQAAVAAGLPVRFDDGELERRRQTLMAGGIPSDS